jgi:hypothetical protein
MYNPWNAIGANIMDVGMFFNYRTVFIRQFYESAAFPFEERKRKIEMGEPPFDPPYAEESDPPFLQEWIEADQSLDVLGQLCISLLSASIRLYLEEWLHNFLRYYYRGELSRIKNVDDYKAVFKKYGWFSGYKIYFSEQLHLNWDKCPSNLALLEEVVLARNRAHHPEDITTFGTRYSEHDIKKLGKFFFVDEREIESLADINDDTKLWLLSPRIKVSKEKLYAAIREVEAFSTWLEKQFSY